MKKKVILLLFILILLSGCENKKEDVKNEYITMKNQAFSVNNYKKDDDIPISIVTSVERVSDEVINYKVVINNPKENMHKIKAIVVHDYYNEDVFPSIGLFDESKELLVDSKKELVLKGSIKSTENISKLKLDLRIYIKYLDDFSEKKDIYYKTT